MEFTFTRVKAKLKSKKVWVSLGSCAAALGLSQLPAEQWGAFAKAFEVIFKLVGAV